MVEAQSWERTIGILLMFSKKRLSIHSLVSCGVIPVSQPREGNQIETLVQGNVEVGVVCCNTVDWAGLALGVFGVEEGHWFFSAHVPQADKTVTSCSTQQGVTRSNTRFMDMY